MKKRPGRQPRTSNLLQEFSGCCLTARLARGMREQYLKKPDRQPVTIISAGHRKPSGQYSESSNVTRYGSLLGIVFQQVTMILVDFQTAESIPVIMVTVTGVCEPKPRKSQTKKEEE